MSDQNKCKKKSRKGDRLVNEMRTLRNKRRRAERQARVELMHASKRARVSLLRKEGAVRRLKKRIAEGGPDRLHASLSKAIEAVVKAEKDL